jgi:virginiamycin B lyase
MKSASIAFAAFAGVAIVTMARAQEDASAGLPAGAAQEMVSGVCTGCHQANMITRSSGYTREGWKELTSTMIDLSASPETQNQIVDYLAQNFPPNTKRAAKLIAGPAQIAFKEWQAPTLGQRARDPVEASDGSIWWVGQFGNVIGRLDPATGAMKEYQLPPKSLPHSVTLDRDGNPWFTGNGNGTIGKLDAKTGEFKVYTMPDPAARDPHTAEFDRNGVLWFTAQQSNFVGRLDPANGDIKLVKVKTPDAKPYGIKIDANGAPWFACNGSNCLVRINPATMELTEIKLPNGATARRLEIAEDGMIWYANASQGRLGRYNPKTGEITEWPSPSGRSSQPYGLTIARGAVWYNESGMRPDALVRFDPRTEEFQSWAIPSGGVHAGIVRHMRPTRDGDLLIHQSSTNRIIRVSTGAAAIR